MSGLALGSVTLEVGRRVLLADFELDIAAGEIVTLVGPSGAGKSTLLAFVAGTLPPGVRARGRVELAGERLDDRAPEARRLGLLLQEPLLFPHMTVLGNLLFALPRRVRGHAARRAQAEAALEGIGLPGCGGRDPRSLSGGERSRVALARCLLAEPRALLLDEPFSALDPGLRREIRDLVLGRARQSGLPTLLVSHDPQDAEAAGGRVQAPWAGDTAL